MALPWRPLTRSEWRLVTGLAILIWCACAPPPPRRLAPPRNFSGKWTGRTSQGGAMAFTVSANRITALTFDYVCDGGSGNLTIPADVPLLNTSGRAAATVRFSSTGPSGPARIFVRFLFQSVRNASGTVEFTNDPACGSREATWTATK
jgi:hypothetical protein